MLVKGISSKKMRMIKGQFTIFALFMTVITIIAYSYIYPVLKTVIDDVSPQMDEATSAMLSLSPLIIFFFILYSAMWYVIPQREER